MTRRRTLSVLLLSCPLVFLLLAAAWKRIVDLSLPKEEILINGLASRPYPLRCSQSGHRLLFVVTEPGEAPEIRGISVSSTEDGTISASDWSWVHPVSDSRYTAAFLDPRWSPDGKQVAILLMWGRRSRQIYLLHPDQDQSVRLTEGQYHYALPRWANHGSCLVATRSGKSGKHQVVRIDLSDNSVVPLTEEGFYASLDAQSDGTRVLAVRHAPSKGIYELIMLSLEEKSPRCLLQSLHPIHSVQWSPEGQRFLFIRKINASLYRLETMQVGERKGRILVELEKPIISPQWSPSGEWISFRTPLTRQFDPMIAKIPWQGGQPVPLTSPGSVPMVAAHDWCSDDCWIFCVARGKTGYWRISGIRADPRPWETKMRRDRARLQRLYQKLGAYLR